MGNPCLANLIQWVWTVVLAKVKKSKVGPCIDEGRMAGMRLQLALELMDQVMDAGAGSPYSIMLNEMVKQ